MVITPHAGGRHRDRLRLAMAPLKSTGVARWTRDLTLFGDRIGPGDLILILTDGFDDGCIEVAERLAASGRDVCLIQILTVDERDFPFDRGYRFHDPETGAALVADGPALRQEFLARFAAARAALSARLDARGVRHVAHFIDESADQPIRALFRTTGRS
jgi:uncharacterized protein (DUF58 family)